MAGVPYRGPVRVVREAMVREEVEAQEAPSVLGLAPALGEAARATSRGPVEEKTPGRLLTDGETVFVPGQGPGIPTEVRARPGTGIAPGRLLPFGEVLGEYAQQAREHMERSPVPQGYKDLVRRYFTELER